MQYKKRIARQKRQAIFDDIIGDKKPQVTITGKMLWYICLEGARAGIPISNYARYLGIDRSTLYKIFDKSHKLIKPVYAEAVYLLYKQEEINQGIKKYYGKFPSRIQANNKDT